MGEAMDKLAAHHMALAFLEELESLQGYPLDNMTKEAMYKEAINLAQVMGQGKKLMTAGAQMVKNPAAAAGRMHSAAQQAALKAQMSPMGQMMTSNPAAATTLLGGQIAGGIGGMLGGKASGSMLNAAAGATSNPLAKQSLGMAGSLTNMFT